MPQTITRKIKLINPIKLMKYLFQITAIAFAISLLTSCMLFQPIQNISPQPVPSNLSLAQVTKTIKTECEQRDWHVTMKKPGLIIANHVKNHHFSATIKIKYSTKSYSIEYVKSENLLNDQGQIHRNYNKWVILLDRDIRTKLKQISQSHTN